MKTEHTHMLGASSQSKASTDKASTCQLKRRRGATTGSARARNVMEWMRCDRITQRARSEAITAHIVDSNGRIFILALSFRQHGRFSGRLKAPYRLRSIRGLRAPTSLRHAGRQSLLIPKPGCKAPRSSKRAPSPVGNAGSGSRRAAAISASTRTVSNAAYDLADHLGRSEESGNAGSEEGSAQGRAETPAILPSRASCLDRPLGGTGKTRT